MSEDVTLSKKERLQYIDALRGFAMLMVVFAHVEIYSFFNFGPDTCLTKFISTVHMPLFFFISGLCIYKPNQNYALNKIRKDFCRLVIPAFVVGFIYTNFKLDFLEDNMKAGYWFTLSLFEMLLIYYVLSNIIRNDKTKFTLYLWGMAIVFYVIRIPLRWNVDMCHVVDCFSLHQTFTYFIFFCLGITIAKHKLEFDRLLKTDLSKTVILLSLVFISYFLFVLVPNYSIDTFVWRVMDTLARTFIGLFATLLFYILFKYYLDFDRPRIVGRGVLLIGNNTLPIYLLHYFFLPSVPAVGIYLNNHPSVVVEVLVGLLLSIIIIAACLILKKIITTSNFIARLVLGQKDVS